MYICIIVCHTQDPDNVIIWDMEQDIEGESYEIEEDYLVVWDINGKPYIVTDKKQYSQIKGALSQLTTTRSHLKVQDKEIQAKCS